MKPNFALRKDEPFTRGWEFGERALRSMQKTPRPPESHDFVPAIEQKGVICESVSISHGLHCEIWSVRSSL